MQKLRTTDPDAVYGIQDTTVQFFPESGLHKILLVEFLYYETAEESARKRGQASGMLSNYLKQTDSLAGRERVQALADLIRQGVTLVQSESFGDADMPWAAGRQARHQRGLAVALKQACNQLGLYSVAVIGTYGGAEHWWNMVFVDNTWYHIDLSRGVLFCGQRPNGGICVGRSALSHRSARPDIDCAAQEKSNSLDAGSPDTGEPEAVESPSRTSKAPMT